MLFLLCCCVLYEGHSFFCFFFFKQKTAYEMRISDWSSDVCSSDLFSTRRQEVLDARRGPGLEAGKIAALDTRSAKQAVADRGALTADWQDHARAAGLNLQAMIERAKGHSHSSQHTPAAGTDRQRTRLNSSHYCASRMPPSACKKNTQPIRKRTIPRRHH